MGLMTNERAIKAKENNDLKEAFIKENENYIMSVANRFSKHFISKSDDEWSIALIAFSDAISTFDEGKGNFASYAKLIIERRLTDQFRSNAKLSNEIKTEPFVFEGNFDDEDENAAFHTTVVKTAATSDENPIRDEILALNEVMKSLNITFMDLTTCSPKSAKTREQCKNVVRFMKENEEALQSLKRTGNLPGTLISKNVKLSPKILERYRKYIITAVEIATGDYPLLVEYIK